MKFLRRQFLHLAAGAAALPVAPRIARAQAYPTRPVRIVGSFPATNGVDDLLAQVIGRSLSERLGQPVTVDNQPIGRATEIISHAAPDGHTLFLVTAANVIRALLDQKLNFSFTRDVTPVGSTSRNMFVVAVNPAVGTRTLPELIAHAASRPGTIRMASTGTGGLFHLAGELFKIMSHVDLVHVPYEGGAAAVSALTGGQAQIMFATIPMVMPHVRSGALRTLAVTAVARSKMLPDVPTVGEFVPGYEATGFQGLCAPKNTPAGVVEKLSREINATLADPRFTERLGEFGNTLLAGSSADYAKILASEAQKWTDVIRTARVTLG
jgi:tripartite-type tricarboxylate transporter receptor subunit TctC